MGASKHAICFHAQDAQGHTESLLRFSRIGSGFNEL